MKEYYIHIDNKQEGPFGINELKELPITEETLVWFEGAENWLNAANVDELKVLFKSIPPPIPKPTTPLSIETPKTKNKLALKKWVLPILGLSIVLVIIFYQSNKQAAIQQQLDEKNAIIKEQQNLADLKEAEEQQKKAALEKKKREEELAALKNEYDNAITSLRFAKERLEQVKQFKLLRTPDEKAAQVKTELEVIRNWENEVERINNEIIKYKE
jgi:hypothetical protein